MCEYFLDKSRKVSVQLYYTDQSKRLVSETAQFDLS